MFKAERLQKISLRGWLCVAASEGFPVKAVVAGLFVYVVSVGKVRGEEGHLTVVAKDGVGLLEVAIDRIQSIRLGNDRLLFPRNTLEFLHPAEEYF